MNDQQKLSLAKLSLAQLNGALASVSAEPAVDKATALKRVEEQVLASKLDYHAVVTAVPVQHAAQIPSDLIKTLNEVKIKAQESLTQSIKARESVSATIAEIAGKSIRWEGDFRKLSNQLTAEIKAISKPDPSLIVAEIHSAVGKAFESFKQEAPVERLVEIASELPSFNTSTAREVFGDEFVSYNGIDFGDFVVNVWGDHRAPQIVSDYVFNPEHLHQALIALDDPLPDNVWLAGERGTGKTEFVTQLAARLQRPLFRINFDEALERADFIGGNSIEDGNVVWKPGIITQAIQTPGAIVLLDEIGFARAQSLATLHALCERSPHRAIVVSETGQRIPVASHVVFFCADNSTGHGDSSGNFAGVREQNTAFLDRFSFTLRFEYLSPADETALICKRTGLSFDASKIIVNFADVARQKARSGLLTQPPSLRQLFAWARAVKKGLPAATAFQNSIVNKFPSDCAPELEAIFISHVNVDEFKQAL